jgi:XTP/dITP diphosphohydrolase
MLSASGRLRTPPSAAQRPPEVMGSSPEGPLVTFASGNEHKLHELRQALPGWEVELLDAREFPPEEGETYYENARAKAEFGRMLEPSRWVLGEDSGVEIDGLGGAPGVRSARWAAGDHVGRALAELRGVEGEGRRARYVCELVAISPEGDELRGTGLLDGRIAEEPRGNEGFGFDPVFIPDGEQKTVAELGNEWKREHSHRARAARALLETIPV